MPRPEVLYDKTFNMSIESEMYDEIKKRAYDQKRSQSQIARTMFEKCMQEDEIDINKEIKEIKSIIINFDKFLKDWIKSIENKENLEL